MRFFRACAFRYALTLAIGGLIAVGRPFVGVSALAQTPAITVAPTITTIAGDGSAGFSGDGGPATDAQLNRPIGITTDVAGNIYFTENNNQVVRKISPDGTITTVAGNGSAGFSGDGGPATDAQLNDPRGLAVDATGNIYIAETRNCRIRKVNASNGTISTIAGNGSCTFSGDHGPATQATLIPSGVALDAAGNIYISDYSNGGIRKISAADGTISTVAGDGSYSFSGDGGPAISASFKSPVSVAVDATGNIYIGDNADQRIRKVNASNGFISTIAGNGVTGFSGDGGVATNASLNFPNGVAVDTKGNVYIADSGNDRIRKVDTNGLISTLAGNGPFAFGGDGGPAAAATLSIPYGVGVDAAGHVYIPDSSVNRVREVQQSILPFRIHRSVSPPRSRTSTFRSTRP